ncbi:hypothetical protein [Pseudomonas oryzicola]|uniref:Uncharacterized protein n=1 Tax=Pseudomonas oryzicola TaxID=485876 RepID=A0ABS6Q7V5_9PSED|nr:hypothetical protein [Pseudomonas oryzicola]MBV4490253.1 hypothetical protein [Pseudomonas oryzicola]
MNQVREPGRGEFFEVMAFGLQLFLSVVKLLAFSKNFAAAAFCLEWSFASAWVAVSSIF